MYFAFFDILHCIICAALVFQSNWVSLRERAEVYIFVPMFIIKQYMWYEAVLLCLTIDISCQHYKVAVPEKISWKLSTSSEGDTKDSPNDVSDIHSRIHYSSCTWHIYLKFSDRKVNQESANTCKSFFLVTSLDLSFCVYEHVLSIWDLHLNNSFSELSEKGVFIAR